MMIVRGGGQVTVGQGHHRVLLVPRRRHGRAELLAQRNLFDDLFGFAVRCLDEVRYPSAESTVVRVVWKKITI